MAKRQIFYSFHFNNDVFRVQQIRNIGALEENKPVSANEWEEVKSKGDAAIEKWIEDNMKYRSCVVVLVGEETANRPWVKYEIKKAWNDRKGLLGVHVHNLKDPRHVNNAPLYGKSNQGTNPFSQFTFRDRYDILKSIPCKNPSSLDTYNDIKNNLENWVEEAIRNNQ